MASEKPRSSLSCSDMEEPVGSLLRRSIFTTITSFFRAGAFFARILNSFGKLWSIFKNQSLGEVFYWFTHSQLEKLYVTGETLRLSWVGLRILSDFRHERWRTRAWWIANAEVNYILEWTFISGTEKYFKFKLNIYMYKIMLDIWFYTR